MLESDLKSAINYFLDKECIVRPSSLFLNDYFAQHATAFERNDEGGYVSSEADISPKAQIHPSAIILGNAKIGANSVIGPGVLIAPGG